MRTYKTRTERVVYRLGYATGYIHGHIKRATKKLFRR